MKKTKKLPQTRRVSLSSNIDSRGGIGGWRWVARGRNPLKVINSLFIVPSNTAAPHSGSSVAQDVGLGSMGCGVVNH